MRKKRPLLLTAILLCLAAPVCAQQTGTWRVGHVAADSSVLKLDTLSIVPQTFYIQDVTTSQYRLDPLTATLYIIDSTLLGQRLFYHYEVFSSDFSKPVAH